MRGRKVFEPANEGEIERWICSIDELSAILGVSSRTIRNYVARGLPRRQDKRFYLPSAIRWHERYIDDGSQTYWAEPEVEPEPWIEEKSMQEWIESMTSCEEIQLEFERETKVIADRLMREFRI